MGHLNNTLLIIGICLDVVYVCVLLFVKAWRKFVCKLRVFGAVRAGGKGEGVGMNRALSDR